MSWWLWLIVGIVAGGIGAYALMWLSFVSGGWR